MKKIVLIVALVSHSGVVTCWPPILTNCRNTCFFNASLQVLYSIDPLRKFLVDRPNQYVEAVDPLAFLFTDLFKEFDINTAKGAKQYTFVCEEDTILERVATETYKTFGFSCGVNEKCELRASCGEQQDANEFISGLLDVLMVAPLAKALIEKLFKLSTISHAICLGKVEHTEKDELKILTVPLLDTLGTSIRTLSGCFKEYFGLEKNFELRERNDCTKQLFLTSSSDYLLVSLNRQRRSVPSFNEETGRLEAVVTKVHDRVYIPQQLNIAEFFLSKPKNKQNYQYQLQAVIVHSGPYGAGHYWAYVQEPDGQWYKCDDLNNPNIKVSITDPSVLQEVEGGSYAGSGYFFVYKKISITQQEFEDWRKIEASREVYAVIEDFSFDRNSKQPLPEPSKPGSSSRTEPISSASTLEKALGNLSQALTNLTKALGS